MGLPKGDPMTIVTVYTRPGCMQCKFTFDKLEMLGLEYVAIDVSEDPEAFEHIKSLGYSQLPVVITDGAHWSGLRPDRLVALASPAA
jgi:glutaredoxin-like protein NrdH